MAARPNISKYIDRGEQKRGGVQICRDSTPLKYDYYNACSMYLHFSVRVRHFYGHAVLIILLSANSARLRQARAEGHDTTQCMFKFKLMLPKNKYLQKYL